MQIIDPIERTREECTRGEHGHQFGYEVRIRRFSSGAAEYFLDQVESWESLPEDEIERRLYSRTQRGQGDRARSIAKTAQRARATIRRKCIEAQLDRMVTLTTRANIQSPDIFFPLLSRFLERYRKATRSPYIAVVERQERGALHAHIAVRGRQDYKLVRALWVSVLGGVVGGFGGGASYVTNPVKGRRLHPADASRRIAGYLAKYIGKGIEGGDVYAFNKKHYWASKDLVDPPIVLRKWFADPMAAHAWLFDFQRSFLHICQAGAYFQRNDFAYAFLCPPQAGPPPPLLPGYESI